MSCEGKEQTFLIHEFTNSDLKKVIFMKENILETVHGEG